jgi:hypothetical protein
MKTYKVAVIMLLKANTEDEAFDKLAKDLDNLTFDWGYLPDGTPEEYKVGKNYQEGDFIEEDENFQ